jgi:dihydrolipoamide dehydrogenase
MTERDIPDLFDLLIIGGGPAGGAAAETALRLGKKIAVVERDQLGGT